MSNAGRPQQEPPRSNGDTIAERKLGIADQTGRDRELDEAIGPACLAPRAQTQAAVERVSERLREDGEGKPLVFRDSMIGNIRDLVDIVPRLNIFGDETLAQLCSQVKDRIASVEPNALRPSKSFDPVARASVKREADALKERFAGYFAPVAETAVEPVREAA